MKKRREDVWLAIDRKYWDHMVIPAFKCVLCEEYYDSVKDMEEHILKNHTADELLNYICDTYDKFYRDDARKRLFSESIEEHKMGVDKYE